MPAFGDFNNRLPDPTFTVNDAGAIDASGNKGPGFASVRMASVEQNQVSRTRSGRGVHRGDSGQHWQISIRYNPMTREEFDIVNSFLESRGARKSPFFVVLPQYSKPKNSTFATFVAANFIRITQNTASGSPFVVMDANGAAVASWPRPGDFFTITDAGDINHLKAYKVVRVETPSTYQISRGAPAANTFRIWTDPPLQKFTNSGAQVNFLNPQFRVMMRGDVIEHELDTENTFEFGLDLEEIMP
jgi:hypothetical protein